MPKRDMDLLTTRMAETMYSFTTHKSNQTTISKRYTVDNRFSLS